MSDAPQLVVGTAGHIDHGKSRLVLALTGTDPDRLPEEKARGMTIDLGFAHTQIDGCNLWFVDVPGHERFIRNMVAGATGVDVALLTVAGDDSVMPQTREHAELLSWLGVDRCVVALTKMDLVDDEWADAVEEEVTELLDSLHIEAVKLVRTSVETGRGIDELRDVLGKLAREGVGAEQEGYEWFRLPVDRAFNIAGRGTVVTGSVAHGSVRRDEELELWPPGRRVRVRDLQTHYEAAEAATGHMRLAVNLAGVPLDQVGRGCELATPGYLEATRRMDVWIASVRMPGKVRRQRLRLRLHIATSEVLAELRLLAKPAGDEIRGQFGQLATSEPVVAAWGQRFILRDESGSRSLGGGRVLRPVARLWRSKRPADPEGLQALLDGPPKQRLAKVIRANEWTGCNDRHLATRAGLPSEEKAASACRSLIDKGKICVIGAASERLHVHRSHLDGLSEHVVKRLRDHLKANPRLPGVPRSEWPSWMPRACPQKHRPALAEWLIQNNCAVFAEGYVVPPGHAAAMSPEDQALFEAILEEFRAGAFQPPALSNLKARTPKTQKHIRELVNLGVARGKLVRVADGLWFHADRWVELTRLVTGAIRERGDLTVGDIRTLLDSSRKYVVPLAEYLDAVGITRRVGDRRTLGPNAPGD